MRAALRVEDCAVTKLRRRALATTLLLLAATLAQADSDPPGPWQRATWKVFSENDSWGAGSDRNYTQGIQVQVWFWESDFRNAASRSVDSVIAKWCEKRGAVEVSDCSADVGFGFGQSFYTPRSIVIAEPQLDEHPWGGYLFVSSSLAVATRTRQHLFESQVGIIGPSAQAQWVQTEWHAIVGGPKPLGWSNQIKNEAAAELLYTYRTKFEVDNHVDAIVELGGGVGTVRDYVSAGMILRAGQGLAGFGKRQIRAFASNAPVPADKAGAAPFTGGQRESAAPDREKEGFYAFMSSTGRWVPFDTFLRGGTFHRIPTNIDAHDFTWEGTAGVVFSFRRPKGTTTVALEEVWRSPEFNRQWQRFLSIVFTIHPSDQNR